jgi:hypothetical protein
MNNHYPYDGKDWIYIDSLKFMEKRYATIFPDRFVNDLQGLSSSESNKFIELASAAFIAEQPPKEVEAYFRQAQQYQQVNFFANIHAGETAVYNVRGVDISVTGKKISDRAEVRDWHSAFCLALILREKPTIELLCQYNSHEHNNDSRAENLPFEHAYCAFVQGLYNPKADLQALLNEVVRLSGPEHLPEHRQPYIYFVIMPFIDILLAILANDETRYQQAINKALVSHRKFYAEDEKRKCIYQGWLALPICAAAALAYEQCGFKLAEPSAYIAEWLVYGEFE